MTKLLPPDTPDDLYPIPYARRRVDKSLPIPKNVARELKAAGVRTMADFDLFLAGRGHLREVKGIGPKTEEKIMEAYESLQETRKWIE